MIWEDFHHTYMYKCVCILGHHNIHFEQLTVLFVDYTLITPKKKKVQNFFNILEPPITLFQTLSLILRGNHYPEHILALPIFKFYTNGIVYYVAACVWLLTFYVHEFHVDCYVCPSLCLIYCWVFYLVIFVLLSSLCALSMQGPVFLFSKM